MASVLRVGALALCGLTAACHGAQPPPAPDYAQPASWAAWPGRLGAADSVPQGIIDPALPAEQQADVFFIHPTTDLSLAIGNARYDEPGSTGTRIEHGVLRYQASTFNGCCRIYAPHYRQASIGAFLKSDQPAALAALELAYGDVQRAFDYYLAHENHGRPFIIASHSQGSLHALRLLQARVAGKPLQAQLVGAYVIGAFVPLALENSGLKVCRAPHDTGCIIVWNSVSRGSDDSPRENRGLLWLAGRYQSASGAQLVCVNPLNWAEGGTAAAALNRGAVPASGSEGALPAPLVGLTGAACHGAHLEVDIPFGARQGFRDTLSLFGSYHVFDYNLFYMNVRDNAKERVLAFRGSAQAE